MFVSKVGVQPTQNEQGPKAGGKREENTYGAFLNALPLNTSFYLPC